MLALLEIETNKVLYIKRHLGGNLCVKLNFCFVSTEMIICKILEDPQSSSCLNISYGEIQGLVANPHPTGSPYAPVSTYFDFPSQKSANSS